MSERSSSSASGFGLVETVIAMGLLGLVALSSMALTVANFKLERANRNVATATALTQTVLEEMQSYPFAELFARFNADPADDPAGFGSAPGNQFTVSKNQTPLVGTGPTEMPLEMNVGIQFPANAAGQLSETATLAALGNQQWDLDGDGTIGTVDPSASYVILPLSISISWSDESGPGTISTPFILVNQE